MSNEVATRSEAGALGAVDFGAMAGAGFENIQSIDNKKIPFIVALQGQSKPVLADDSEVRPGQLYNTASGEAYDGKKGIVIIPVYIERAVAEFKPNQGGHVGRHPVNSDIVKQAEAGRIRAGLKFGKLFTDYTRGADGKPVGNQLVDTRYVYCLVLDENNEPAGSAMIAFKSSDTPEFKRYFGTVLAEFKGGKTALCAHPTRITAELNKYDEGSAYNLICAPAFAKGVAANMLTPENPLYIAGAKLYEAVKSGLVQGDFEAGAAADAKDSSSDDAPF